MEINIPSEFLDKWLNKVERDNLCIFNGYKAVSFLNEFKKALEESNYIISHLKSHTNLYKISINHND